MEHISDSKSFGALVKGLRAKSGLPGRAAAAKIGVSPSTLTKIESGRQLPMGETMILILRFYGETATVGWDPDPGDTNDLREET